MANPKVTISWLSIGRHCSISNVGPSLNNLKVYIPSLGKNRCETANDFYDES